MTSLAYQGDIFHTIRGISSLTIMQYYAPGLQLKKHGSRWLANCLFHPDKTPSFTVFADGGWKCFGCGQSGDAVDFVGKLFNLSSIDAAWLIARDFGVDVDKPITPEVRRDIKGKRNRDELHKWFDSYCEEKYLALCEFYRLVGRLLALRDPKYLWMQGMDMEMEAWLDLLQYGDESDKLRFLLGG